MGKFIRDYRKASLTEREQLIDDYNMMQKMRMSIYDMSDVAYDAFLLNGHSIKKPWVASVKRGDVVRLRFIGASGSTIFQVKIPGTTMQMIHIDGNDVKPYEVEDFTIAPGETYDVLVNINQEDPYIIYAESIDTVGAAYGALISSPKQWVNYLHVTPFPEPLPVTRTMMAMMMNKIKQGVLPADKIKNEQPMHEAHHHAKKVLSSSTPMGDMPMDSMSHDMPNQPNIQPMDMMIGKMDHAMKMDMPTEAIIIGDKILPSNSAYRTSSNTKYEKLIATVKTNDPNKPVAGVINMELFGDMDHYIWFINGVPENKAAPIVLEPGKRYRFVFSNISMMHHPMHIHGHWFILRTGKEAYDPLLHTIDVAPGATITADVDTDASGQWLFHCHLLYHMVAGMARTFQYSTLIEIINNQMKPEEMIQQTPYHNRPIVRVDEVRPIDTSLVYHPMAHADKLWFATFLDIAENPKTDIQKMTVRGLYGSDFNKLELVMDDAEIRDGTIESADVDFFYWHLLNQFWAIKGGVNYFYRPSQTPYWQPSLGIEGIMPYFINTEVRGYFYHGSAKLDIELSRDTQITNNVFIGISVRSILASKTVTQAEIGSGLNEMRYTVRPYYRVMPGLNVFAEFEREQAYGAYKTTQRKLGESATQNTLTFGVSMLF